MLGVERLLPRDAGRESVEKKDEPEKNEPESELSDSLESAGRRASFAPLRIATLGTVTICSGISCSCGAPSSDSAGSGGGAKNEPPPSPCMHACAAGSALGAARQKARGPISAGR